MSDIQFGIKITADGSVYVTQVDGAKRKTQELGDTAKKTGDALRDAGTQAQRFGQGAQQGGSAVEAFTSKLRTLITVSAGLAIAKKFADISDSVTLLNARLAILTNSAAEAATAQRGLYDIAQRLQVSYTDVGASFTRVITAIKQLGGDTALAIKVTELLAATTKISGASASEAAASMIQFAQAIGSGRLQGDELRSILENNIVLAESLAKGMGTTIAGLRQMGEEGKLTADKVVQALLSQAGSIEGKLAQIPTTFGGAFEKLGNVLRRDIEKNNGAFQSLSKFISDTADVLDKAGDQGVSFGDRMLAALNLIIGRVEAAKRAVSTPGSEWEGSSGRISRGQQWLGGAQARTALDAAITNSDTPFGINKKADDQVKQIEEWWTTLNRTDAAAATEYIDRVSELIKAVFQERDRKLMEYAKKGQAPLAGVLGEFGKMTDLVTEQWSRRARIETDGLARELSTLERYHAAGLTSETEFINRRHELRLAAVREETAAIDGAYQAKIAELDKVTNTLARSPEEKLQKDARIEQLLRDIVKLYADLQIAAAKAQDAEDEFFESGIRLGKEYLEMRKGINRETEDYARRLQQSIDEQFVELDLIGKSATEQAKIRAERQLRLELDQKILDIEREIEDLQTREGNDGKIAARRQQQSQLRADTERAVSQIRVGIDLTDQASRRMQGITDAWNTVDSTLREGFTRIGSKWSDTVRQMGERLKASILNAIYELTVQRFALNMFAGLTGVSPAALAPNVGSGYGGGLGGMGGLFGLNPFGEGFSFLGNTWGGGTGNILAGELAAGTQGFVPGAGVSPWSAGLGGGAIGAGVGMLSSMFFGNGRNNTGMTAGGTIGGIVGGLTPLGPLGAMIGSAIGSAIGSLFSSGGGEKSGGYSAFGNVGGLGRLYTPSGEDAAAAGIVNPLGAGYAAYLKKFGGSGTGGFFAGFDTDPSGTANNRASVGSFVNGRQVYAYYSGDDSLGRDSEKLKETLALESERALLAALQASELPERIASILNAFTASTATKEDIDNVLAFAEAYTTAVDALKGSIADDAAKAWEVSQRNTIESIRAMGDDLVNLAAKSDGTAESVTALAAATNQFRAAVAQTIVHIKQLAQQISASFAQDRANTGAVGLEGNSLYDYWKGLADQAIESIANETDPDKIAAAVQTARGYGSNAWNSLTPEQQLANKNPMLQWFTEMETYANNRLEAIGADLLDGAQQPFDAAKQALEAAADKMIEAGRKQSEAGDAQQAAANTQADAANTLADAASSIADAAASLANASVRVILEQQTSMVNAG